MNINRLSQKSDKIGAWASGLCLLHCVLTPFIFAIQPLSANVKSAPTWWSLLDFVFLVFSFFAVYLSAKKAKSNLIKCLMWISWFILTAAILNEKLGLFHWPGIVVYIPAVSLILLHIYNSNFS